MPIASKPKKVRQPKKPEVNERAILAAKDVLKRLRAKKLTISNNSYIQTPSWRDEKRHIWDSLSPEGDLQEQVDIVESCCKVCADGAFLLSAARLFDNIPMKEVLNEELYGGTEDAERVRQRLENVIDRKSLDLMEVAFEGVSYEWTYASVDEKIAAKKFGRKFKSLEGIVRGCMKNIIANGGIFKP